MRVLKSKLSNILKSKLSNILKSKLSNILLLLVLGLLIVPYTRQPIQVALHKIWSHINIPTSEVPEDRERLSNYNWQLVGATQQNQFDFNTAKGKVVVINFWATWCPPCVAEMPSLQKLYDHFKNDEVVFLFVSNEASETVRAFKEKNGYNFEVYSPVTDYSHLFKVNSIPRTFIIDKEGRIAIDKTGAVNWNSEQIRTAISQLMLEE